MSRLTILDLTDDERAALEKGHRHGNSHAFRIRCHMILLKAERLPSTQIATQLGFCMMTVNGWVKRYQAQGIARPGDQAGPGAPCHPRRPGRPGAGAGRRAGQPPARRPCQSRTRTGVGQGVLRPDPAGS